MNLVELLNLTFERELAAEGDSNVKFAPLVWQDLDVDKRFLMALAVNLDRKATA